MTYEVELKFRLIDQSGVVAQIESLGGKPGEHIRQQDRYFNHPSRDFAETNEALRIRTSDGKCYVTYKGPLVDSQTKTRREIELQIGQQETDETRFAELLALLGFQEVGTVAKSRQTYELHWEDRPVELMLDDVADLGPFLEIETLAEETDREPARDAILRLAERLGVENSIRKSYLCLLLENDSE